MRETSILTVYPLWWCRYLPVHPFAVSMMDLSDFNNTIRLVKEFLKGCDPLKTCGKLNRSVRSFGKEEAVRDVIRQEIRDYADEIREDTMGNLIAVKGRVQGQKGNWLLIWTK